MVLVNAILDFASPKSCSPDLIWTAIPLNYQQIPVVKSKFVEFAAE
jgi:hypothetical protein